MPQREHAEFVGMKSQPLTPELVQAQDAVMIITDHDKIDYAMIAKCAKLIIDTRNVLSSVPDGGNVVKA